MTTTIRRWVETDTGHRVPNHSSKCAHLHGHRYRFEAEISGELVGNPEAPDDGMVLDFSDVSRILTEEIHDVVDHAFLVQDTDAAGERRAKPWVRITGRLFCPSLQRPSTWPLGPTARVAKALHEMLRRPPSIGSPSRPGNAEVMGDVSALIFVLSGWKAAAAMLRPGLIAGHALQGGGRVQIRPKKPCHLIVRHG